MNGTHRLVLDTDIGSDADDALALACIFGSPDITLDGITTVYGDTVARAGIASRLCELAGRAGFPIVPGLGAPRSRREVWWAGFEGSNFHTLDSELIRADLDAPEFLAAHVAAHPGEIDILAIGPLTNIAAAIDLSPSFVDDVRQLVVMGGDFGSDSVEHNFRSDADAARAVFDSSIRCTVTGLEATSAVRFEKADFDAIESWGPLGAALSREIGSFLGFAGRDWSSPHDPMSLLPLLDESRFDFSRGHIEIAVDGPNAGASSLVPASDGPARVVSGWDASQVRSRVLELVFAGCGGSAS